MKRKLLLIVVVGVVMLLGGCSKEKNFVGTWEGDLLDQSTKDAAGELSGSLYGGFLGSFASALADEMHWNATLDIRSDGTLTMDAGMAVEATWEQGGDTITISGDSIAGTATLSDDQKTLYFSNTISSDETTNGFAMGSSTLDFEFTRKD